MNPEYNDQNTVSQFYKMLNEAEKKSASGQGPNTELDTLIKQAAYKAVKNRQEKLYKRIVIPLSLAASLFVIVGGVAKIIYNENNSSQLQNHADLKVPMFLMQRSKPASADLLIEQIEQSLNEGRIDRTRVLHQKLHYYYPDAELAPELIEKLHAENIR